MKTREQTWDCHWVQSAGGEYRVEKKNLVRSRETYSAEGINVNQTQNFCFLEVVNEEDHFNFAAVFVDITRKSLIHTAEMTAMKEIQKREDIRWVIYTAQCWPSRKTEKITQY